MMRNEVFGTALLLAGFSWGGALDNAWVKGVTDKDALSYRTGEKIVFTLTMQGLDGAPPAGEYFLDWKRSGDDAVCATGRIDLVACPFVYETTIDRPGFVRLQAKVVGKDGKPFKKRYTGDATTPEGKKAMNAFEKKNREVFFDGSAGAEVATLRTEPEPEDFDAFWKKQFARLDRVPLKAETVELECRKPSVRVFAVQVACAGLRPTTGYLSVPRDTEKGRTYPAVLSLHGYSGAMGMHHPALKDPPDDKIVFDINAHGMKLPAFGATEADLRALRWEVKSGGLSYAFDPKQNADPEIAYFNGMVLRIKRALQYLKTVKGWDGRNLVSKGGSQGGLQSMWAAGLVEDLTVSRPEVPWCADLGPDAVPGRVAPGWRIAWTPGIAYYDCVNHAKRAKGRVEITRAGLGDTCCMPSSIAALYNNLPADRRSIVWVQGSKHGYVPPMPNQSVSLPSGKTVAPYQGADVFTGDKLPTK